MPDAGSLRMRRMRLHSLGDHTLCKRCAALRPAPRADVSEVDPRAALNALACNLIASAAADPSNAVLARELRLTLQALAAMEPASADPLDELRGIAAKAS